MDGEDFVATCTIRHVPYLYMHESQLKEMVDKSQCHTGPLFCSPPRWRESQRQRALSFLRPFDAQKASISYPHSLLSKFDPFGWCGTETLLRSMYELIFSLLQVFVWQYRWLRGYYSLCGAPVPGGKQWGGIVHAVQATVATHYVSIVRN